MVVHCSGICLQYKWNRSFKANPYLEGAKRCMNECGGNNKNGITIKYDGLWCPCCHKRLRSSPRHAVSKRHYNKVKNRTGL